MAWLPKNTVVVPVDFSDESLSAVEAAMELVKNASRLHVIHVLPTLDPTEPGAVWSQLDNDSRREDAIRAVRERLPDAKFADLDVAVAFGDPGQEIANFAESLAADLVVMPSHGRTGIKRLLIGSVAERVVRLAHCPVLVLKG
jgi:nucleotide-binding universal stress UspA family protein